MLPTYRSLTSSLRQWLPRYSPSLPSLLTRSFRVGSAAQQQQQQQGSQQAADPRYRGNPLAGGDIDHQHSSEPYYQDYFNVESFFQPPRPKRPKRRRAVDQHEQHVTELPQPPSELYKHHPMLNTAFDWSPFIHPDEAVPEMKVDIEETETQYVIHAEVPVCRV